MRDAHMSEAPAQKFHRRFISAHVQTFGHVGDGDARFEQSSRDIERLNICVSVSKPTGVSDQARKQAHRLSSIWFRLRSIKYLKNQLCRRRGRRLDKIDVAEVGVVEM